MKVISVEYRRVDKGILPGCTRKEIQPASNLIELLANGVRSPRVWAGMDMTVFENRSTSTTRGRLGTYLKIDI